MRRFRFRLEALQRVRAAHRDDCRAQVAKAHQAEQILTEQLESLRAEIADLRAAAVRTGPLDIDRLLGEQRHALMLQTQEKTLLDQLRNVQEEIEKRRLVLVEADREVKILEKLREQQWEAHRREAARHEANEMTEIVTQLRDWQSRR